METKSLYDRLGGEPAINAVVEKFQEFMLSDPITKPYFEKTDMKLQAIREKQWVAMVTGGPQKYEGADMKKAHANMKVNQEAFDATWNNLNKALACFNVPEKEVSEIKAIIDSYHGDIVLA